MATDPGPDVATATGTLSGVAPFFWTAQVQVVPTVQAAAYAAGAAVGGLLTFAGAARTAGGSGLAQAATCCFASGVVPSLDLVLFSVTPGGGTITDRVVVAIATADLPKIAGVIHLSDATLLGAAAPSLVQGATAALPFKLPPGASSLFGVLITRTAVTLTSTTDATVNLSVMQD